MNNMFYLASDVLYRQWVGMQIVYLCFMLELQGSQILFMLYISIEKDYFKMSYFCYKTLLYLLLIIVIYNVVMF